MYEAGVRTHLHSNMSLFKFVTETFFSLPVNLHSNMSLFKCITDVENWLSEEIYIPICLYLNGNYPLMSNAIAAFTFQYVSI